MKTLLIYPFKNDLLIRSPIYTSLAFLPLIFILLSICDVAKAENSRDLSVILSKAFRGNYAQEVKQDSSVSDNLVREKLAIINSAYFIRYSIDKYKESFTKYLSGSDISRILKTNRFTNEEKIMLKDIDEDLRGEIFNISIRMHLERIKKKLGVD